MRDRLDRRSDFSERVIIVAAGAVTCVLASAHAIWHATGHHLSCVDPRRLIVCLSLIFIACSAGFDRYLLQWRGLPRNAPPRRLRLSAKYRPALRDGVAGLFLLFCLSLCMIGGIPDQFIYASIGGYFVVAFQIICRRPENPTVGDLAFIRGGVFALMGIIPVAVLIAHFFR